MQTSQREILTLVIAVTCLLALLTGFMALTVIVYNKRKRKMMLENEVREKTYQKEILQAQLEIQEQTLKNISQEIHDNIGQMLSLAKLNLALVETDIDNPKINDSHKLVSKAIQDLRDLSKSLDSDYVMQMGLLKSIEYELEMIEKTGICKTKMTTEGQPVRFDKQKELILFRIVQESLNNILKHADASCITVTVSCNDQLFSLSIKDDGKGVDLSPIAEGGNSSYGLGIRNMHNRAKMIGADYKISSTIGKGTEVTISLPVNE